MARKTLEEQIADNLKKQEQLRAKEKELKQKQNEQERKDRTKRLIELGATVEAVLGRATVPEDKERLRNFLNRQESNGRYFSKAMNE